MVNVALFVRLEAKPGKELEVEQFLRAGLPLVQEEAATTAWFALPTLLLLVATPRRPASQQAPVELRHLRCVSG